MMSLSPSHRSTPAPSSPGRLSLSPGKTEPWEISLQALSASLSQICSSPTSPKEAGFHGFMKNGSPKAASKHPKLTSQGSFDAGSQPISPKQDELSPSHGDGVAQRFFMKENGRFCRRLRVRHEESRRKLQEKLAFICRKTNKQLKGSHDSLSLLPNEKRQNPDLLSQRPVIRRESIKMTFRRKVNTEDIPFQSIAVKMLKDSVQVYSYKDGDTTLINEYEFPSDAADVDAEKVMCFYDTSVLDIKQYPQKYVQIEHSVDSAAEDYWPVMTQDDKDGYWKMVLYVPNSYQMTGMQIKTLDDKLFISWPEGEGRCKMVMDLPHNVDTRTVSGVVSEDNQIILQSTLTSGRDRCFTL